MKIWLQPHRQCMIITLRKHKNRLTMRKILSILSLALVVGMTTGCKEEKKSNIIITEKPKPVTPKKPQKMGDYEQSLKVEWRGIKYTVEMKLTACDSLPMVKDGANLYFDNVIVLRIVRPDGSVFYSHKFTKRDFDKCLTDNYRKNGALLGIVYVKSDSDYLYFAASVGSPDKSSDEYIPLVLKVHRLGSISIEEDTMLDTGDSEEEDEV